MALITLLVCITLGLSTSFVNASPSCPNGATYEDDFKGCLSFHSGSTGFKNAEHSCNGNGGHLLSIHNAFQNSFIHNFLAKDNEQKDVWIGFFMDVDNNRKWTWTDGSNSDYTKWGKAQPTHHAAVIDATASSGYWESSDQNEEHPYFCLQKK